MHINCYNHLETSNPQEAAAAAVVASPFTIKVYVSAVTAIFPALLYCFRHRTRYGTRNKGTVRLVQVEL